MKHVALLLFMMLGWASGSYAYDQDSTSFDNTIDEYIKALPEKKPSPPPKKKKEELVDGSYRCIGSGAVGFITLPFPMSRYEADRLCERAWQKGHVNEDSDV